MRICQIFLVKLFPELVVREALIVALLVDPKISKDADYHVEIKRHSTSDGADGHHLEHALCVEIRLSDSQLLDRHMLEVGIQSLSTR